MAKRAKISVNLPLDIALYYLIYHRIWLNFTLPLTVLFCSKSSLFCFSFRTSRENFLNRQNSKIVMNITVIKSEQRRLLLSLSLNKLEFWVKCCKQSITIWAHNLRRPTNSSPTSSHTQNWSKNLYNLRRPTNSSPTSSHTENWSKQQPTRCLPASSVHVHAQRVQPTMNLSNKPNKNVSWIEMSLPWNKAIIKLFFKG
jgi:hypothetical protein